MLPTSQIELICEGRHGDPFSVLGPHRKADGAVSIRVFLPGAQRVWALPHGEIPSTQNAGGDQILLSRLCDPGFFEGSLDALAFASYRLLVHWHDDQVSVIDDPYRFAPVIDDASLWLLSEGTHLRPYEVLGANLIEMDGVTGTRFAVWAPNAMRVSVMGDFNAWDARRHPMRLRPQAGVWEIFLPHVGQGDKYKFSLLDQRGMALAERADPYSRQAERQPGTASIVAAMPSLKPAKPERARANALGAAMSIYEVHLGSWRKRWEISPETGNWLNWDELADQLIPYASGLGFTHLELLPISEHPFNGSWGYQPLGLYAVTSRFGEPAGFERFVARSHEAGLGVLLDWVPAHFPNDDHGLARFDGTALFEYEDPREGFHMDWNTLIYNYGRREVSNYLIGNALYWMERYGVDGLRVDAVTSMLYRDYSREVGQWIPNHLGGRENLEAIAFLKRLNEVVGQERPGAITLAEESAAFPLVSHPTFSGGLGFHYKWNMGWMHDTLAYMTRDPVHRRHHQGNITFGLLYAFQEHFVLPLSHDEVVHGKGSLLHKMPGDRWQQLANLRAYFGLMFAHPGKKLLFMGCEFAQEAEWDHDRSLDWQLLENPAHAGIQNLVRDLNRLYRETSALHDIDHQSRSFEWVDHHDAEHSVFSFLRRGQGQDFVLVVCNFTPVVRGEYRVGVPCLGNYVPVLNTDAALYGGSDVQPIQVNASKEGGMQAQEIGWQGRPFSISVTLPPLATLVLRRLC